MGERYIEMAKLAEQAEQYEDMAKQMKDFTKNGGDFDSDEKIGRERRNLLSVAYKNVVGTRRSSWRIIANGEQKLLKENIGAKEIEEYRGVIENELKSICNEVIVSSKLFLCAIRIYNFLGFVGQPFN